MIAPAVTMRAALADPQLLGSALSGDSWSTWRTLLIASMGEPLTPEEMVTFTAVTGRTTSPPSRVEEALWLIGRRGGKDRAASVVATYLSTLVDWSPVLARGERGVVLCIGPDQKQAGITMGYVEGVLQSSPILSTMIAGRTQDAIALSNGIDIEVRAASFRRLRGPTSVAVIATEAAFLYTEESANADTEILNAVRPSLATTGGPLIVITTPYSRKGEVWNLYRNHYGRDGDPLILVAQGASRHFNPSLPERVVQRALERDHAAASAEFLAHFRNDIESFVSREVVENAVDEGVVERPPCDGVAYVGHVDPSGGRHDSMTLAIAHKDEHGRAIVDLIREVIPPLDVEATARDFANDLKRYRCRSARADRYGAGWTVAAFRRHGIEMLPAAKNTSELYAELLPPLNSGLVRLVDNKRAVAQISALERRTGRIGKDRISHPPQQHDDVAAVVAGAVFQALQRSDLPMTIIGPVVFTGIYSDEPRRIDTHGGLRFDVEKSDPDAPLIVAATGRSANPRAYGDSVFEVASPRPKSEDRYIGPKAFGV